MSYSFLVSINCLWKVKLTSIGHIFKATISATEKWKFFVIICIKVLFGSNNFDNLN